MPESNKTNRKRAMKANRAAGVGDESGRMPARVKEGPKMMKCTVCASELKATKTNTELTAHADAKHGKGTEDCFPGATKVAEELRAAVSGKGKGKGKK